MKRAFLKLGVVFFWVASELGSARGALVLTIDSSQDILTISGSDTANPLVLNVGEGFFVSSVSWTAGSTTGSNQSLNVLTGLSSQFDTADLTVNTAGGIALELSSLSLGAVATPTTVTGLDNGISYASLSVERQAVLEAAVGSTLALQTGNFWAPISVVAVPEPGVISYFVIVAALGLLVRTGRGRRV